MNQMDDIDFFAKITEVEYTPLLCSDLELFYYEEVDVALSEETAFILQIDPTNQIAVSRWVSPKRTRSFPYPRVYNTLNFVGKKVAIIPIVKDEGGPGDRDYLQWDTISLMSLLDVHVIISYYADASISSRDERKITDQRFNSQHIRDQIDRLKSYQSSALHWNMNQIKNIHEIGLRAVAAYSAISERLDVEMHSLVRAEHRINRIYQSEETFMTSSRELAQQAQARETVTIQPKERVAGAKGKLTIANQLGGYYFLTCDEFEIHGDEIYLIEAKHTKADKLPSLDNMKDASLKMILFTNLESVITAQGDYKPVPIVKLTTGTGVNLNALSQRQHNLITNLTQEAQTNGFQVIINDTRIV